MNKTINLITICLLLISNTAFSTIKPSHTTENVSVLGQVKGDFGAVAVDDEVITVENSDPISVDVLANDSLPKGGAIITAVTQPANGTAIIDNPPDSISYQPNSNYCNNENVTNDLDNTKSGGSDVILFATDNFNYTISGGSSATVFVTVNCESLAAVQSVPVNNIYWLLLLVFGTILLGANIITNGIDSYSEHSTGNGFEN